MIIYSLQGKQSAKKIIQTKRDTSTEAEMNEILKDIKSQAA